MEEMWGVSSFLWRGRVFTSELALWNRRTTCAIHLVSMLLNYAALCSPWWMFLVFCRHTGSPSQSPFKGVFWRYLTSVFCELVFYFKIFESDFIFHSWCCLYLELWVCDSLSNPCCAMPWRDRTERGTDINVSLPLNSQRPLLRKSFIGRSFNFFIVWGCFHRIVLYMFKPAEAFFSWVLDNLQSPEHRPYGSRTLKCTTFLLEESNQFESPLAFVFVQKCSVLD